MSSSDDAPARVRASSGPWRSAGGRAAFWIVACMAPWVLCAAWFLYGFAFMEEMTEECKSLAAGTSSAGIGLLLGGIPLVLAHGFFLLTLVLIGANFHSRRSTGVMLAVAVVVIASAIGIAVNELVWTGNLFAMSAAHANCLGGTP